MLALAGVTTAQAETPKNQQTAVNEVTRKVPFGNYWDANSWEADSAENFWKATPKAEADSKKQQATAAQARRRIQPVAPKKTYSK